MNLTPWHPSPRPTLPVVDGPGLSWSRKVGDSRVMYLEGEDGKVLRVEHTNAILSNHFEERLRR